MSLRLLNPICYLRKLYSSNCKPRNLYSVSFLSSSTTVRIGKLVTMKIDKPLFQKLFTPELKYLSELFKLNNYEIRIAGGAVRDLLMDMLPVDVDFATTATPDQMKDMFEKEGVRMINKNGEKHGTITSRINDKENFEVTTLRIDVRTDGRHAEVEFTKDWQLDANRRDLTVNSMFLGLDGTLYDYFNGREDVNNRCIRFVGDAASRIQEDYLRILRYFRFFGRISQTSHSHAASTLQAIKEHAGCLSGISGERIWTEMKKIVIGNFASDILCTMFELDILQYMGFSSVIDTERLKLVWNRCKHLKPHPMVMVAAMLDNVQDLTKLNVRLRLSNDDVRMGYFILENRDKIPDDNAKKYLQDMVLEAIARKEPKAKEKIYALLKYEGKAELSEELETWQPPKFPVNGRSLIEIGLKRGPKFQKMLDFLRTTWIESNYQLTEYDLIEIARNKQKSSD